MNTIAKFYNKIATKYSQTFDNNTKDRKALNKFLKTLKKKSKILDLGCGTGRFANYYAKRGHNVIGIDFSKEMIRIGKRKYKNLKLIHKDMLKIKYKKETFDAICITYSLFHVTKNNAKKVIKNSYNWLKPNGILFLVLQEGHGHIYFKEGNLKAYTKLYTKKEIKTLLKKFKIILICSRKPKDYEMPYNKLFIIAKKKN